MKGGFARCFEVTDFQGTRLAAKCVAKKSITSEKVKMKLLGEIKVHKSMDHPNIVRQRDCFEDEVNVYMILDICTKGTLMDMLRARKSFTEPEVRYFGIQILGAVKYMHSRRVIHRDLKLGNLFLDENMCIKVGDFGLAALLVDDDDRKKTFCGTPNYIAPEVLFGNGEGHSYEVDLWSIGVIFYAMLVGKPPFQSKDVKAIYAKIKTNEYDFPASVPISASARELITSLLCPDPQNRPSIDDIASHNFFTKGVMPRSIHPSATEIAPRWPDQQAYSIFERNLKFVSINAGVGQNQVVGKEQGQVVDINVELPERGRYLPSSLSPRTGPTAKMLNLHNERAGGRIETIADRLKSVRIEQKEEQRPLPVEAGRVQPERRTRESSRTTLATSALRSQKENLDPRIVAVAREKPRSTLGAAVRPGPSRSADSSVEGKAIPSRLRGAKRVVSEPSRPITRSSRFTKLRGLSETPENSAAEGRTANVSANSARPMGVRETGPAAARQSSSRTTSDEKVALVSRLISRVEDHPAETTRADSKTNQLSRMEVRAEDRPSIWKPISTLADTIEKALGGGSRIRTGQAAPNGTDLTYISKWVDYSHRYGLGYQLSDASTGVYFNDSTSIILPNRCSHFTYVQSSDVTESHKVDIPPKELEKKVYLLRHFKGYMTTHLNNSATTSSASPINTLRKRDNCYMTHYWRTKAGILFRLSDGTLQLNFTDHSKLMIPQSHYPSSACVVRYISVSKVNSTWSLASALQNPECREKLDCAAKVFRNFAILEGRASETVQV